MQKEDAMTSETPNPWWRLSSRIVFIGFLAVSAFFLIGEHRAHVLGWLPFLLVLVCPLMHLFHGHGGHHERSGTWEPRRPEQHQR
jgi:hypothetical protein